MPMASCTENRLSETKDNLLFIDKFLFLYTGQICVDHLIKMYTAFLYLCNDLQLWSSYRFRR